VTTVAEQVPSAASSLAGAESLTGTATVASSWLLVEVRGGWGGDGIGDFRLVAHHGDLVTFAAATGELAVRVEARQAPLVPASCGAEPEPTVEWATSLESSA
jgi:hypothetical protein